MLPFLSTLRNTHPSGVRMYGKPESVSDTPGRIGAVEGPFKMQSVCPWLNLKTFVFDAGFMSVGSAGKPKTTTVKLPDRNEILAHP